MGADLDTLTRRPNCADQHSDTQAFWRDPALPFVESCRAYHSRACYKPHHHPAFLG